LTTHCLPRNITPCKTTQRGSLLPRFSFSARF
jgi:hypothetical protein